MEDLIGGIQIIFGSESLTPGDRAAAIRMIDQLRDMKGEGGIALLRAVSRGEIEAADAIEAIFAPMH